MTIDSLTATLSGLAILVSIWAAAKAHSAAAQQNLIQERLLKLESARERDRVAGSKRANLSAEIRSDGRDWLFVVRNDGPGQARAIQVLVDNKSLPAHERILCEPDELVTTLGPGAKVPYVMAVAMGSPLVYEVSLIWEDDSGDPGRWESQLHI